MANEMQKTFTDIVNDVQTTVNARLEEVREALKSGNLVEYGTAMAALKKAVSALNDAKCNVAYSEFMKADAPMIAAVKQFYITLTKIKEERDKDGDSDAIIGVNLEDKSARIDLEKFCEFARLDKTWARKCCELRDLLELRETELYALAPDKLASKSFYFINAARKKKEGATPDSNTQIVTKLQEIIDAAIFVDNGEGKNAYKCNNHDIAFIQDAVTKFDAKSKCSIAMLNERQFKTVMMSVFARCLGESYSVKTGATKKSST